MKLDNLLKYQEADLACKKLLDEIRGNSDYREMKKYKNEFNIAKQKVSDSETLASTVISTYSGANEYLEKNSRRAEELCALLENENISEEEEKAAVSELESLRTAFAEWEKKAAQLKSGADKALMEYSGAQKSGKSARDSYSAAKENYEKFKASKEDELQKLKSERDKLESGVDSELLEVYKSLTAENKYPAFVPALGDENSPVCSGCGMMLADAGKNDLKNKGYCRCETCRKIIYKP